MKSCRADNGWSYAFRFEVESNKTSPARKRTTMFDRDSCSRVYTRLVVADVKSASLSPVPGKEIVTVAVKPCY
jgi:hypothetical protein